MRAHLAGVELGKRGSESGPGFSRELLRQITANHPYRLISFAHTQKEAEFVKQAVIDPEHPDHLIVDSGAFSFMFGNEAGQKKTLAQLRDYSRRYLDTLDSWGFRGTLIEVDAQRLVGVEDNERLREMFWPLGDRVMFVWHAPDGIPGLLSLAERASYIGIGFPELRFLASGGNLTADPRLVLRMANDLILRIHKHCRAKGLVAPRIHLLGCTSPIAMETRLAYSCDSTSWLAGVKFGTTQTWSPSRGIKTASIRSAAGRAAIAKTAELFPDLVRAHAGHAQPDYFVRCATSARAFAQYQSFLDSNYPYAGDPNVTRNYSNHPDRQAQTEPLEPEPAKRPRVREGKVEHSNDRLRDSPDRKRVARRV